MNEGNCLCSPTRLYFTVQYEDSGSYLKVITGFYTASIPWNGHALSAASLASSDAPRQCAATRAGD